MVRGMSARAVRPPQGLPVPPLPAKGRGTLSNADGRFERFSHVREDDSWGTLAAEALAGAPPVQTQVEIDTTRDIIARNSSPDISFDRSINPYRGCEHGCVYCFARPTHAYLGFSPGLDFETRIKVKPRAAELLEAALHNPRYTPRTMALGTNTDPYQPLEREYRITRGVLEVLAKFNHPVGIVTKSHLVTRDIDILSAMAAKGLAKVAVSVTTLDATLARKMEPRASTPEKRLQAIRELKAAGIPTAVMTAPLIPALNDMELETILERAAAAGADSAGYGILRLPLEIKDLFREWLEAQVPDKAEHVMKLVRSMRGGLDYDMNWGRRMTGTGPYANLIAQRFRLATRRLGLNERRFPLDLTQFARPPRPGDATQLNLL
ncbi:MAG: PA0069 family radical SAM protein [Alphaproteobacteria bacterium]|nr:PA0069 family radical SAM protein [Alphaproteobacteria bacterium]